MSGLNTIILYSILIPLILISLIYLDKKYMWTAPVIMLLLLSLNLLHDVMTYFYNEPFIERMRLYFYNDTKMSFLIYIPILIVTILYTTVFYIAQYILKRKKR